MSRVDIFKREEISITLLYFINDQDRQTQKHIKHPYLYFKVGFREERACRGAREGGRRVLLISERILREGGTV